jgi:uncharacterized membrane protein YfcA
LIDQLSPGKVEVVKHLDFFCVLIYAVNSICKNPVAAGDGVMLEWIIYPPLGVIVGIIAGLLGIGGGVVIVPILVFVFTAQGFPGQHMMQIALATSLGSIIFTSVSSFMSHHRHGAVRWEVVRGITLGILIGTFSGTWLAAQLSTRALKIFFACFLYYVAATMLSNFKPKPTRQLPGLLGLNGVGLAIGVISSLVGIGGGALSIPFMMWCNVPVHHAIGTSAAIGFPIAIAGTLGYILNGLSTADLPTPHIGYLYIPALFGIAFFSFFTAPYGARLAHKTPVVTLKRIYAVFLIIIATRIIWGAL